MAEKLESKERNKILKTLKDWKKPVVEILLKRIISSKILLAHLAG